jgi:uncharacterized protein DUF1360
VIPSPWVGLVLALGTFRVVRLIGWDDWPYAKRLREWAGGRNERNQGEALFADDPRGTYRRPVVAKFLSCPWCVGFWVGCGVYVAWLEEPKWTLYVLAAFALNAAVGLIARNLDP